jgi:hypothetical protein
VGAVLYYLLTGKPPLAAVARVVKDPMNKLADAGELAGVSRSFRQAVDDALAVHSSQRIPSIAQLRQALQLPASQPQGCFSQASDEVGEADSGQAPLADVDVPALQPSEPSVSPLDVEDEPAGTALEPTVQAVPTAPGDTLPRNLQRVIPAKAGIQAAYPPSGNNHGPLDSGLRGYDEAKAVPQAHPSSGAQVGSAQRSHSPGNVQPDDGAPAPPAGVSWAPVFSQLGQSTRMAAKALKRNAALVLKSIARPSRLRNAAALGMAVAVGFAAAFALWPKPAPDGAGASSLASSPAQPPADGPANTAMAPPQIEAPTTAGYPPAPNPTSLVHLSIKPWGQIAVDGRPQGVSPPMTSLSLAPGQHLLFITHGGSPSVYMPITVPEGKDIEVAYQFE